MSNEYVTPFNLVPKTVWEQAGWMDEIKRNRTPAYDLGARLRAVRREVRMSQTELARRLGMATASDLCGWEKGRRPIPASRIRPIEDILGRCLYAKAA